MGALASLRLRPQGNTPLSCKFATIRVFLGVFGAGGNSVTPRSFPRSKVRYINVVDLFKLQQSTEHPHGLTSQDFDSLELAINNKIDALPWRSR